MPLFPGGRPAQIIEIADYDCPFCRRDQPSVDSAIQKGVRIAYLNWPLPEHIHSKMAAVAALCADRAGRFRAMHDQLLTSQLWAIDTNWTREAAAAGIGNIADFNQCMRDTTVIGHVNRELALADSLHADGTPTFVAGGKLFSGTLTTAQLVQLAR